MNLAPESVAAARQHLQLAELAAANVPGVAAAPESIASAGVVGAGTMGTGIALAFAGADVPTIVIDSSADQVRSARERMAATFAYQVGRGRLSKDEAERRVSLLRFERDLDVLRDVDIVVEAVFENIDVKKALFPLVAAACKPEAIIASNTSTLDVDAMAVTTGRPDRFVGLHFFVPANIMKLLEVVRGAQTSEQTLATALALAGRLGKVGIVAGNAFGFVANKMIFDYIREALIMAEEGLEPEAIDAAIRDFGFAMGPFAMCDLSGLDVLLKIEQGRPEAFRSHTPILKRLNELGRFGQKAGKGIYRYEPGGREPLHDDEVVALFRAEALHAGARASPRSLTEIVERLVYALVNAGADLLHRGIALRAGDIDVAYVHGFGFPRDRGGPMWYADSIGLPRVLESIRGFGSGEAGSRWTPSPFLVKLATADRSFAAVE